MLKQYKQSTIDRIKKKVENAVKVYRIVHDLTSNKADAVFHTGPWVESETTDRYVALEEMRESEHLYRANIHVDGVDFIAADPDKHYNIPIYRFRTIVDIQIGTFIITCPYCGADECFDLSEFKDILKVSLGGCDCYGLDQSLDLETKCNSCNKDLTYNIL